MIEDPSTLPKRKHPRLKEFDYCQLGSYFVTICVKGHAHMPLKIHLSIIGVVANDVIQNTSSSYNNVSIENYVIMPNHIHLLVTILPRSLDTDDPNSKNISLNTVIRSVKTMVTKNVGHSVWQDSFYDHIIRDDTDYQNVWDYIEANPYKWQEDELFG
jgi:putative transposase